MTRKHFEAIAAILNQDRPSRDEPVEGPAWLAVSDTGSNLTHFSNLKLVSDLHSVMITAQQCYLCKGIVARMSATNLSDHTETEMRIWPMGAERQVPAQVPPLIAEVLDALAVSMTLTTWHVLHLREPAWKSFWMIKR